MKSCSTIVNGNVSVLNFIFQYYCIVYKSFYDLYVILIVKPYFKAYGFDLLNHILKLMVMFC